MSHIRVYCPVESDALEELHRAEALPAPRRGFAVTDWVRSTDPEGDEESWEYAATQEAAFDCLSQGRPVALLAADIAPEDLAATSADSPEVQVGSAIRLPRVAAFHLGDDVLEGSTQAIDEEIALSWFDTTELPAVVDLVRRAQQVSPISSSPTSSDPSAKE